MKSEIVGLVLIVGFKGKEDIGENKKNKCVKFCKLALLVKLRLHKNRGLGKRLGVVAHTCNPSFGRPRQSDHWRSGI